MTYLRAAFLVLILASLGLAAPISYGVVIDTYQILGSSPAQGNLLIQLTSLDPFNTTTASITNVSQMEEGTIYRTPGVTGSLEEGTLQMTDAGGYNGEFQAGATFYAPFSFTLNLNSSGPGTSNDLFQFTLFNDSGYFTLFSFSQGLLTVQNQFVSVSQVSVPEPSSLAVLLLLLAVVGGTAFWQRRPQVA